MGEIGVPPALEAAVESLKDAVTAGRTDIVRKLLDACDTCDGGGAEERKQLINSPLLEDGGTFLHLATQLGHSDCVRALLAAGGDPGVLDSRGKSPLQLAADDQQSICAVYTEDLLRATAQSDLGRVCQLIAGGISVNAQDNCVSRNTPLHWAAAFADSDTLHCLIARGASVENVNSDGATPLHDAVARGDPTIVEALLQHGAKPTASRCTEGRHKGLTPLELAEAKGGEVLAVMKKHAGRIHSTKARHAENSSVVSRGSRDTGDLRALAGSLESLNSLTADGSLILPSQDGRDEINSSIVNGNITSEVEPLLNGIANNTTSLLSKELVNGHVVRDNTTDVKDHLSRQNNSDCRKFSASTDYGLDSKRKGSLSRSPIHSISSIDCSPSLEEMYKRLTNTCIDPPDPIVTNSSLHLLWPQPKVMTQMPHQSWTVPQTVTFAMVRGLVPIEKMHQVIEVHKGRIEECGVNVVLIGSVPHTSAVTHIGPVRYVTPNSPLRASNSWRGHLSPVHASVVCCVSPALASSPLKYTLNIVETGVNISCGSLAALHSAIATFTQLLTIHFLAYQKQISNGEIRTPSSSGSKYVSAENYQLPNQGLNGKQNSDIPRRNDINARNNLLRQASEPAHGIQMGSPLLHRAQSEEIGTDAVLSSQISAEKGTIDSSSTDLVIEGVHIEDSPDVPNRGFMLDAAPLARIPSLALMFHIVDTLASLKINQLHLMMCLQSNSSFNNSSSDENRSSGINSYCYCHLPYSEREIMELSEYCEARGISIVPAFDLDPSWSAGRVVGDSVLELTNAVSATLSCFPNVSTVSIGPTLTSVIVSYAFCNPSCDPWARLGIEPGTTLLICSNMFINDNNRDLYNHIPLTAVLMEYGFQANYNFNIGSNASGIHDRLAATCPGTAAWSSLSGFPEAGISNVFRGCVSKPGGSNTAIGHSPSSVVIAHWSTPASLTPLVFMWPALVVGAGISWNSLTHFDYVNTSLAVLIDTHLVKVPDSGFGVALVELGRCETWITRQMRNQEDSDLSDLPPGSSGPGSILHQLLADPDSVVLEHLLPEKFGCVLRHIKRNLRGIANNRVVHSLWPLMPVAAAELNLSADLMMTAARIGRALVTLGSNPHSNLGMAVVNPGLSNLPATHRTDIANRLLSLRESYSCLWLHSHQPAGLQASLLLLSSLLSRLLPHHSNIHNL